MSTEYRPGIPSHAHIEAATRLGLLWHASDGFHHCFRVNTNEIEVKFALTLDVEWDRRDWYAIDRDTCNLSYRPIRPDGTPVDWETLDAEVARVAGAVQPQGFRADLWRRICSWITSTYLPNIASITSINDFGIVGQTRGYSWDTLGLDTQTDEADRQALIARWAVYLELKPLYDLVDGAQGEAAMPRDVDEEWCRRGQARHDDISAGAFVLRREQGVLEAYAAPTERFHGRVFAANGSSVLSAALRNFAAVLDAAAERRVAERMRGQTQAPTVTSAQPELRRFADVRPDRHGWRWWRVFGSSAWGDNTRIEIHNNQFRVHLENLWRPWVQFVLQHWLPTDCTVIPTDEQGNPVSWESIGQPVGQVADLPGGVPQRTTPNKPAISAQPAPLPRFTADELDDVDHSRTTKLDQATLRRGRLPTVEQIAKYREVRAKRTGGTVAEALKESCIDCEVAQYVLERWAGGLGDADTVLLLQAVGCMPVACVQVTPSLRRFDTTQSEVDQMSQDFLRTHNATLDTSEKPSPTMQRDRQEAEERRQRLAQLRQRLAAERAAQPQEMAKESEASRFDLIEPDPQADPTASIRAWEARQAAAKLRPMAAPARPTAAPRRPAIEVVDAEADGLSRVEIVTALVGRAFNGGC